jgi:MoaA/NifB/PqqE/SkfB family radical SAM enzyme
MLNSSWVHSVGAVVRNSLRVEPGHFRLDLAPADATRLFKEHVELVEVETTSYCNRTCSFCPNSFIDRLSEKLMMPEPAWQAILAGLEEVGYDGTIVWSRYSEPLSERRILNRIREVRRAAPRCRICVNSNGDFLDADYLGELEDAGLDRLWIDVYIPDEETYNLEVAKTYHDKLIKRIDRSYSVVGVSPELSTKISSNKMEIAAHARNVAAMLEMDLSDRGGLIQIARATLREAPCYAPYKHLVIDWDGSVVICCQLRSDSLTHQRGVVGKIGEDGVGLVDAYIRLAGWRESLKTYGKKRGPCATCNVSEYNASYLTRALSKFLTDDSSASVFLKTSLRPLLRKRQRP